MTFSFIQNMKNKLIQIWTIQLGSWRIAKMLGIEIIDITAKSGISQLAPTFHNVMEFKNKRLTEEEYIILYNEKMTKSLKENPEVWKKLTEHKKFALACYCGPNDFCHRKLLLPFVFDYLKSQGLEYIFKGELTKLEVFPFFSKESPLSNWNNRGFTIKDITFLHGEMWMMFCKAKLFGDEETAKKILAEPDPGKCKQLGRTVKPFNEIIWNEKSVSIVYRGCLQKAREHKDIVDLLISLENKVIVEASKYDKIWGAGIDEHDPRINFPSKWPGNNQLGYIWDAIRDRLLENEFN